MKERFNGVFLGDGFLSDWGSDGNSGLSALTRRKGLEACLEEPSSLLRFQGKRLVMACVMSHAVLSTAHQIIRMSDIESR